MALPLNVYQTSAAFGISTAHTERSDGADRTSLDVVGFGFIPNGDSKINPVTLIFAASHL
jgi:hypothetical protein